MKSLPLLLVAAVSLSACSTATDRGQPMPDPAAERTDMGRAWTERNGPSAVPRNGWVKTVNGWYRSTEACLEHQRRETAGTPMTVAEECLETGI